MNLITKSKGKMIFISTYTINTKLTKTTKPIIPPKLIKIKKKSLVSAKIIKTQKSQILILLSKKYLN